LRLEHARKFNAADDVLAEPDLKAAYKQAIERRARLLGFEIGFPLSPVGGLAFNVVLHQVARPSCQAMGG